MSDHLSEMDQDEIDIEEINLDIKKYKQMVAENPNNYEAHKELIKNLRITQDFDALKQARVEFSTALPLEQEIWLEWLSDEKQIVSTDEEKMELVELYCTAVKDYNSVDIWVDFIEYLIQEYRDEKWVSVRKYCNNALTMVGSNFEEGHLIWSIIKDFEIILLDKGLTDLESIRKFFLVRLSVPHLDLENTFGAYSSFESNYGGTDYADRMRNASKVVTLTRKLNKQRELKEEELLASDHSLASFFDYIDYLKREYSKKKVPELKHEIKSLFWRAIKTYFWDPAIWIAFLEFLMDGNEENFDYIVFLANRAIKNSASCMTSADLWILKMLAEELQTSKFESGDTFTYAINVMKSTGDNEGLNKILLARVNSGARILDLEKFKLMYDEAVEIQNSLPGNSNIKIATAYAYYVARNSKDFESANETFSKAIKLSTSVEDWLDWIAFSLSAGKIDNTRNIFQLATRRKLGNGAEIIYNSWLSFEGRFGTLKSYLAANAVVSDLRRKNIKLLESSANLEVENVVRVKAKKRSLEQLSPQSSKRHKSKFLINQGEENKPLGDISTYKVIKNANAGNMIFLSDLPMSANREMLLSHCKSYGKVIDVYLYPNNNSGEIEALIEFDKAEVVRKFVLDGPFLLDGTSVTPRRCRPETLKWSFDNEEKRDTVYVKNLPGANLVDKMMIRDHFDQYGKIVDIRLQSKPTYSYAYITFKTEEEAEKSLAADQSSIMPNRVIGVAISNPSKRAVHEVDRKLLYVSNLPASVVESDLERFFESCGKIQQMRLNRKYGKIGYAFIQFEDYDSARKGLQLNGESLDNHVLVISVADPNKRSADLKRSKFEKKPQGFAGGTLTTFVPRAAAAVKQHKRISIASDPKSIANDNSKLSKPKSQSDFRKMMLE